MKIIEMNQIKSIIVAFLIVPLLGFTQIKTAVVISPDRQIEFIIETVSGNQSTAEIGKLMYSVSFQGKLVIDRSALSLRLSNNKPLGSEVRILSSENSEIDENYKLIAGKTNSVHNLCNTLRIELEETGTTPRRIWIEVRAFNDAVAFRYLVPVQPNMNDFQLKKENTEFRISKDATTYSLILPNFRSMYESEFVKLPISAFSNQGGVKSNVLIGLPMLMEIPGVAWLAITEADLRGYSSMYLTNPSGSWEGHWFESVLAPQVEDTSLCVTGSLPHNSPWRIIQISDEPGKLIESNVLTSLNPESVIKETSWIKPGKASWNWWGGSLNPEGKPEYSTKNMEYYVDFAAESGFEYMLIDAGWSARNDITKINGRVDIPEVVEYAKSKDIKIWIWLNYRDVVRQMDEAFPFYEKWGVAGLKIDFIERDDQKGIEFYYRAAEIAARHHLMLDIHGSTKPSGINRTYPNLMGYEGVLGMEQSKAGARDNPESHVTLPFTRMLVGLMDYTPGGFNNVTKEEFEPQMDKQPMVMGTRAHHLAMYAIYEAPFQMVSDHPTAYKDQPSFQFIKDVPATWDEIKVLNGIPGEYITIARRNGDEWFLGSMTNWTPRLMDLSLSFLGEGKYVAEIYADSPDAGQYPKKISIENKILDRNSILHARLATGGGFAVRFKPSR